MSVKTLEIEEVKALFFNQRVLNEPAYKLFRISTPRGRFYFTVDELGEPTVYLGVTTMIAKLVPKGEQLIKWMCDMGYYESKRYATERAHYGTLFHSQAAEFLIAKQYDLNSADAVVDEYCTKNRLVIDRETWVEDLKMDMITFCQFCFDKNVVPLAIEIMLIHPDGYAGTIDLVCEMDHEEKGFFGEVLKSGDNKGQPKETKRIRRVTAAVDYKTGRKGFYDEMSIQLESYRELVKVNFPKINIEKIYNWRPKEWRTEPDYALKDQSDVVDKEKFIHLVAMAKIELMKKEQVYSNIVGMVKLGEQPAGNIENMYLREFIKLRRKVKETESSQILSSDAEFAPVTDDAHIGDLFDKEGE